MDRAREPFVEQELPGIGRRYELADDVAASGWSSSSTTAAGVTSTSLDRGGDVQASLAFSDDQARRLGAVLGGAYFQPAVVAEMEAVIGGLLIDWVTLHEASPGVGPLDRRARDPPAHPHDDRGHPAGRRPRSSRPSRPRCSQAGDRLVVVGRPEDLPGVPRPWSGLTWVTS